jgi:hypothetical protein
MHSGSAPEGIRLHPDIDNECLDALFRMGLRERFPAIYDEYISQTEARKQQATTKRAAELQDWNREKTQLLPSIHLAIARQVLSVVADLYPYVCSSSM